MKTVVITGSTRGIGLGLAKAVLARGHRVVLHSRSESAITKTIAEIVAEQGPGVTERVTHKAGDISLPQTSLEIWDAGIKAFGTIDIWINNAGVGLPDIHVKALQPDQITTLMGININGLLFACQAVINKMEAQGFGHIYNMEGFGSNGRTRPGLTVYGASKAAVRFINRSLAEEQRGSPVKVSALSPGIVITDFITDQYVDHPDKLVQAKKIFNILGDKPETVCPWLVDKILQNSKNGASFEWLTTSKVLWRFLRAIFQKRELFA